MMARLRHGTRFLFILALTFGLCSWLQAMAPTLPSLALLAALVGCAIAGYDFERSNPRQLF